MEEGKEEDRQEEGEEVKGGSQVEETTTTWMAMMMVVSGVRTRLELEPDVSVDEVCEASETLRAFNGCTCGCACCEAPRTVDVLCRPVVNVVIGVDIVVLFVPHVHLQCRFNSHCGSSSNSCPAAIFSHVCTAFSSRLRCGIYTSRRLQ